MTACLREQQGIQTVNRKGLARRRHRGPRAEHQEGPQVAQRGTYRIEVRVGKTCTNLGAAKIRNIRLV